LINVDEHDAATMAPHFWTQGCIGFTLLWIVVVTTTTTESIATKPQATFISQSAAATYRRVERSPDEEAFQHRIPKKVDDLENTEEDLNETQFTSRQSSSEEVPTENADDEKDTSEPLKDDQSKNKPSEPKKYNANDFKSKVNVETKTLASNDSASEKQKLPSYNPNPVVKYNNSFKKDSKLNSSLGDYNFKAENSNLKLPSKFILEKKKVKSDPGEVPRNFSNTSRLNETRLMSDQPVVTESDATHNSTDASDDAFDGFLQNSTSQFEDSSNTTKNPYDPTEPPDDINIIVVSGVTLGTAVLLGLVAGGGFVYYRHRMWNKPQTLSDKCSNADSSGYIDDSTLRENSEEMYSLDNDSFLNSLEAMTIQNYWTDNVKHTKL